MSGFEPEQRSINGFPILSADQAISNLRSFGLGKRQLYLAMYSSVYGGIVTDEALMTIPIDDHMCHRGHAVFDTAAIENGFLYNADVHIDRILRSAASAEIAHSFTKEWIKSVLIAVAQAAEVRDQALRYWISSGAGDFSYSPAGCIAPSFYCIAFQGFHLPSAPGGIREVSISVKEVGMKPNPINTLKSNNYLANVLLHLAAKRKGGNYGLWVSEDGLVKEGPINSVIIVDSAGVVRSPPASDILASCTCGRALALAAAAGYEVRQDDIALEELYAAREVFFVGGDTHVISVTTLDDHAIGAGVPGPVWKLVLDGILEEARTGSHSSEQIII